MVVVVAALVLLVALVVTAVVVYRQRKKARILLEGEEEGREMKGVLSSEPKMLNKDVKVNKVRFYDYILF